MNFVQVNQADISIRELETRWNISRNALKSRARALGVQLNRVNPTLTTWPGAYIELGDRFHEHLKTGQPMAAFVGLKSSNSEGLDVLDVSTNTPPMSFGKAVGFIETHNSKLCLRDERTGFRLYLSCDIPGQLKEIYCIQERVSMDFRCVDMKACRVNPIRVQTEESDYLPIGFKSFFRPSELLGCNDFGKPSLLSGSFVGGSGVLQIEIDPFYEAFFFGEFHDPWVDRVSDVIEAEFVVCKDWSPESLYRIECIDKVFTPESWVEFLCRPASEGQSTEDQGSLQKPARRQISSRLRYEVLLRDGHRCVDCGASAIEDPSVRLEIDHRVPVSKGGTNEKENLQTLCWACNNGKSDAIDHKLAFSQAELVPWATAA